MARPAAARALLRGLPAGLFFVFLILCVLGGGSSRPEIQSQPLIWLLSILCCGAAFWFRPLWDFRPVRLALIFAVLMALIIAVQLVPLPPTIWSVLPGHALYAQTALVTKLPLIWRPISLTPDLSWASLFALLPIFATIIGFHTLSDRQRKWVLPLLLLAIVCSAILGLAQLSAGAGSALRYYPVTNETSAVGIFANRNHHALFLMLGLPMLTVWARLDPGDPARARLHNWAAIAAALFLIPMTLATGSRAGVILGVVAFMASVLLARSGSKQSISPFPSGKWPLWARVLPVLLAVLVIAGAIVMSRASAIDRLFVSNLADEQRSQMIVPLWKMLTTFFPFGSGFGSFDPVYRAFEPFDLLTLTYMNHAHNDLLHVVIEGGLPAALLLLAYLIWWGMRARILWLTPARLTASRLMGRLGTAVSGLMLLASLFDYPLRMPLLGVVFMIATLWMLPPPPAAKSITPLHS